MALLRYPLFYCVAGAAAAFFPDIRGDFWLGLGVLGALISLYGWSAKGPRDERRFETGDNCYFIGFVYTLAVIALSVGIDADEFLDAGGDGAETLLKTVGVALGTSVVGMLWRFGLTHGVKISKNEFDRMVDKTALAANRLDAAVENLESAARRMGDCADSAGSSLRAADEATAEYAARMRDETGRIGKHLTETAGKLFDDFGNRIADTLHKTQFDEVREELQNAVAHHRKAVADTGELLRNSAATLDNAAKSAAAAAQKVDGALDAIHTSVAGQLQNIGGEMESALRVLHTATEGEKWNAVAAAADNFAAQTAKMEDGLRRVAAQQRALVEDAGDDIARLQKMRETFDALIKDLRGDSETVIKIKEEYRRELARATQTATEETNRMYETLTRGAEAAVAALENPGAFSQDLRTIARHLEEISARLKDAKQ